MKLDKLFLSPHGRIGRKDYWIGTIVIWAIQLVTNFIPGAGSIVGLLLVYPSVVIVAKRLHDLGLSGWWQALVYGAVLICSIVLVVLAVPAMMAVSGGPKDEAAMIQAFWSAPGAVPLIAFILLICFGFTIWLGVMRGKPGDNRYGHSPLSRGVAEDFD